ncbi:hypothetical protein BU202_08310 [Streptococcus cuniculi]|uniref:Uncharacterized protein n=1 Tax=Streptococcus cuniculi TaxID=1432788 RepID=A0A1Q8E694_9STRE|nr:hypothetical protein [Streptococcus cuniculi]OLF47320.1 hypothetical protein BU202_08310 [Streptococcus cuniculi]
MKKDILYSYEMLTSDLLTSIGALEIVYRWLDELPCDKLGYYEFSEFKSQYADVLSLSMLHLEVLAEQHQRIITDF